MTVESTSLAMQPVVVTRKEHLFKFAGLCSALDQAIRAASLGPDECAEIFRTAIYADCVSCGLVVRGQDLYRVAQDGPPDKDDTDPLINKLRLGDCPREHCNGYYFRVHFRQHPQVDWPTLFTVVDEIRARKLYDRGLKVRKSRSWKLTVNFTALRPLAVGFVIVLALVLLRQWYAGGRIPLVREPEHFRVDPAPPGQAPESEHFQNETD